MFGCEIVIRERRLSITDVVIENEAEKGEEKNGIDRMIWVFDEKEKSFKMKDLKKRGIVEGERSK